MTNNFHYKNTRLDTNQIFDGLTEDELDILSRSGVTQSYKKGEIIFKEGSIPMGIYWIRRGLVKKYKITIKGGEQIIFICATGELFGYYALLSDEYYSDNSAAINDSEITFIPKEEFLKVLSSSSTLSNKLLKALGHEFSLFITSITNLASKTVRERLAFTLIVIEEKFKTTETAPVQIILSRSDLANIVGTSMESVVRILHEFKELKLIEVTGKSIIILNKVALTTEANQPDLR